MQNMNQSNVFFNVDQEAATKAGGGDFISEGGAYLGIITRAVCVTASTGTSGIELSFEDKTGMKANYITLHYAKSDGSIVKGGHNAINALMVIMNLQSLTYTRDGQDTVCPELVGKPVGLCLQKKHYTKNDEKKSDGYKFELRFPFDPDSRLTIKEKMQNSPAKSVDLFVRNYKDIDERKTSQFNSQPQSTNGNQSQGFSGYQNDPQNYDSSGF